MSSPTLRADAFVSRYGPWALVTGASDGIGRSFAVELARRGIHLVLVARREPLLATLASSLAAEHGVDCRVVAADLATDTGVAQVAAASLGLDIGLVVCAAGFGISGDFLDGALVDELEMLQLNCRALTSLSWTLGRHLLARRRGGLILLSSVVAFQGVPRSAHYAATKAYVQTLAEGLRAEWSAHGVQVLAVAPGPVHTGFARRARLSMGNAATPEVVAQQSLAALRRQGTVRPGWLSKLLGYSLAMTPRWGRVRIMGRVMGGMTRHRGT